MIRRLLFLFFLLGAPVKAQIGLAPAPVSPVTQLAPFPENSTAPLAPIPTAIPTAIPRFWATPTPTSPPVVVAAPFAQSYVKSPTRRFEGQVFVPLTFFSQHLGASIGPVGSYWKLLYFDRKIEFLPWQRWVRRNGQQGQFYTRTRVLNGELWVPLGEFMDYLRVKWTQTEPGVFLLQYPAAYVLNVRSSVVGKKVRTVVELSNPTRVQAFQNKLDAGFRFAGARGAGVPELARVGDYLVPSTRLQSGNWNAEFVVRLKYSAPVSWFTLGNPSRLVIDVQRLVEQKKTSFSGGISLTKIRRGIGRGTVQMWLARLDPRDGWRVRVTPAGYNVMQRQKTSRLARRDRAILGINGGFFAEDGAAVGAVLVNGEWIRLPWKGRTALGFTPDGKAHIGNLQTHSYVEFSGGLRVPFRELNGWPDKNRVTALTSRFGSYYRLRPGEMAVVVENGVVVSTPGSGGVAVPTPGFTLIAHGGAKPVLGRVARGQSARLTIAPKGWPAITTALGGGPRLVQNGRVLVTNENFRADVRRGPGPRTAFGVDKAGRFLILVADGRQKPHSVGLTLSELAATMQKLGAVHALNLDGGGSTALAVRGKVINRPSDGRERSVSNVLLVMQ